jgi:ribosomal protein S18 acetylase RimI-like enzyme
MRGRALLAGLGAAALAAALYRRLGFRPRERAEVLFEDGSAISLAGSPDVDDLAAHARAMISAAR